MSRKTFRGNIVANKMAMTVIVAVEFPKKHKIYGKNLKSTRRFFAHNEMEVTLGDLVEIQECKPYSKNTVWEVVKKLEQEKGKKQ